MLPDLQKIILNCKSRIAAIDPISEVFVDPHKMTQFLTSYKDANPRNEIVIAGERSLRITSVHKGENRTTTISFQEFPVLSILADHLAALNVFREKLNEICQAMGFSSRSTDGESFFGLIPSNNWQTKATPTHVSRFQSAVNKVLIDPHDRKMMTAFVTNPEWGGGIDKKFNRTSDDWRDSAVKKVGNLVSEASAGRMAVIQAISDAGVSTKFVSFKPAAPSVAGPVTPVSSKFVGGENVLFYGAPGTGKSTKVKNEADGKKYVRTVFHPDLQNSDFFGCLKPQMNGTNVEYNFVPGPFMQAYAEAIEHSDQPVYLIIEELNRAAAAAVFGDLFLLLDRDSDGTGEYDVVCPTPESQNWLNEQKPLGAKTLRLPPNLFIYATMNSADQGVYPIDTAFRRRWRHEYLPLDYPKGAKGQVAFVTDSSGSVEKMDWRAFVEILNDRLLNSVELEISEDRLLGQWFVKETDLDGSSIPEKVLVYILDDLLRHEDKGLIFKEGIKTFGVLAKRIESNQQILSADFLTALNPKGSSDTPEDGGPIADEVSESDNDPDAAS